MVRNSARVETPSARRDGAQSRVQTFSSLKHRDYRLLWTGNLFSHMAMWLQLITLGWLVWELTKDPETGKGSALLSSTAAGLRALPSVIIGPWAGVLVDRVDRRKLVMAVQVVVAVGAISFALLVSTSDLGSETSSGPLKVWHVFAYAIFTAVCFSIIMPARQALVVNTVPRKDLANALALNSMGVTVNRMTGALLGGLLISTVGIKYNFFVEAGGYIAIVLLMMPMRTPYAEESTARRSSVVTNLKDGLRYIWSENRILLHLIILNLIVATAFIPLLALLPAYTSEVLRKEADVGGYLMAAQGVGGFIVTMGLASLGFGRSRGKLLLICLVAGSASILVIAQSSWLLLSLVMMVSLGIWQSAFITCNLVLIQSMIPDTLRGRITSIYMLEHGLGPLAIFLMGLFMELYSVKGALTVEASMCLGLSLLFVLTFRQVRDLK